MDALVDQLFKTLPEDPYLFIGNSLSKSSGISVRSVEVKNSHLLISCDIRGTLVDIPKFPITEKSDLSSLIGLKLDELASFRAEISKFPGSVDSIVRNVSDFLTIDVSSFLAGNFCGDLSGSAQLAFPILRFEETSSRMFVIASSPAEAKSFIASALPQSPTDGKKANPAAKKGAVDNPVMQVSGDFFGEVLKIAGANESVKFLVYTELPAKPDSLPSNVSLVSQVVDPNKLHVLGLYESLSARPFVSLRTGNDEPVKQEISPLLLSAVEASNACVLFGDFTPEISCSAHRVSVPSGLAPSSKGLPFDIFVRKLEAIEYPFLFDSARVRQTFDAMATDDNLLTRERVRDALTNQNERLFDFASSLLSKFKFDFDKSLGHFFDN